VNVIRLDNRRIGVRFVAQEKKDFSSPKNPNRLRAAENLQLAFSELRDLRLKLITNPPGAEVKNEWAYESLSFP
jgi:hypothetical protein